MSRFVSSVARALVLGAVMAPLAGAQATKAPTATKAPAAPAAPPAAAQPGDVVLQREIFTYSQAGRRDPFVSLAQTEDLRPLFTDLKLTGILADPGGRRSVAVIRDNTDAKKQYRVTVGSTLGRLRVTRITSSSVTFTVEEFGRNREEVLTYAADSLRTRTP